MPIHSSRLRRFCVYLILGIFLASISSQYASQIAYAADETDNWSPQTEGIGDPYFEKQNQSEFFENKCVTPETAAASGAETPLTFPRGLDDSKMAEVINQWVEKNKLPVGSILEGVGEKAVASAKHANVNPFLVIAQSKYESELGSKINYNVQHGNNSFGRSATASQPNFPGGAGSAIALWYKWSSGEASVDYQAPENADKDSGDQYSYIRTVYAKELDGGDWKAYFEKYAPESGNQGVIYHPTDGSKPLVQQAVEEMMSQAGGSGSSGGGSSGSNEGLASDTPEPGFASTPGTNGHKRILVHTTEGSSAEAAIQALKQNNTSYHTLIEENGHERRLLPDDAIGHGATDSNNDSLHVALVGIAGDGSHFDPDSPQLKTLEKRLAKWSQQYSIPLEKISGPGVLNSGDGKGVAGHGDVAKASPASYAANPRTDPGENFPWDEVLKKAKDMGGSTDSKADDQCCAESDTKTTSVGLNGGDNAEKVFNYLTSKGMDAKVAAGFVGNFMQESGPDLNPTADNGTHRGIAQWDYGSRFGKLRQLKGDKADTIEAQAWYVGCELGLETGDGCGGYKDAYSYIQQATSPEDAAKRVDEKYEVSGGSALDNRQKNAKSVFDKFGDGAASGTSNQSAASSACKEQEPAGDFVYYNQNDPKWKEEPEIAGGGCGPTSIAMIIASKKDKKVTPVDVAKFLKGTGEWSGNSGGIKWSGFKSAGDKWGMKVTEIGKDWNKAKEALKANKFIAISGTGSAPFTSGGHIIVARGITDDDKIIIANPAPMNSTPEKTPYSTSDLEGAGLANMWIFE